MSSEQQCWDILGNHFKSKGFVEHQISSFNKFLTSDIAKVITEEPPIVIEADKKTSKIYKKYTILFSNVHIPSPTVIEEDRTLRGFTPCEARQRDLTYDSPIYVNITTILELPNGETEIEKFNRVVLGRMPIMLRSCLCYLSQMTPAERVTSGECPKDEGGYFIVRGKERVLIPQIRGIYNEPKVYEQKAGNKFKYVAEIRSMSEETGHSALLKAMVGFDNRTIVFSLPYIKDNIPVGVVFKALGYTQDQEIIDLIALRSEKTSKYIRLILRDAYLCEEQSNGYSLFEETENGTLEDWEKLSPEEQKGWQQKMTVTNALNYIGQFSQHTIKDHERENYAKQVIENELFPHMGITATIKEKSYFLGYIVNKLIATHCGLRKDDDKDDYINKRVESPGILCYELFRQLFKKYCQAISSSIEKKKQVPDAMTIITRLLIITNGIRHCFGTGNWGVPKNSYIRTGVCQVLSRLSYGATISNLRRLTIPIGKESKNTKIRQIHPSQIMYICPCETPEGQSIGIVLNLSLLTRISERTPTVLIKEIVEQCDNIISIQDFEGPNQEIKVFLNGILIGITKEPFDLLDELKQLRKIKLLPHDVSISYDDLDEEQIEKVIQEMGEVLWMLSSIASDYNISLGRVALVNINKLEDRQRRGMLKGDGDDR